MAIVSSLSSWVENIHQTNIKATYRALNKAVAKTNTQFKRVLQKDLGVKSKEISKRIYQKKANKTSLVAYVSLGTRFGIGLHHFTPRVKVVKKGKGRKARKYEGITIKVPVEGGRMFVPNAFMATMPGNGKTLVVARLTSKRLPINTARKDISAIAQRHQESLRAFMQQDFKQQFSAQLKALK